MIAIQPKTKVYSMYVEIIASGHSEEDVKGIIEDELDDIFGAENYRTITVEELTEDEVIELETGVNADDELNLAYQERIEDELG